jgi:hypothetical protein
LLTAEDDGALLRIEPLIKVDRHRDVRYSAFFCDSTYNLAALGTIKWPQPDGYLIVFRRELANGGVRWKDKVAKKYGREAYRGRECGISALTVILRHDHTSATGMHIIFPRCRLVTSFSKDFGPTLAFHFRFNPDRSLNTTVPRPPQTASGLPDSGWLDY